MAEFIYLHDPQNRILFSSISGKFWSVSLKKQLIKKVGQSVINFYFLFKAFEGPGPQSTMRMPGVDWCHWITRTRSGGRFPRALHSDPVSTGWLLWGSGLTSSSQLIQRNGRSPRTWRAGSFNRVLPVPTQ